MVKLRFMGGTHEVGRNAVILESGESKVLLDYGVQIKGKPNFPGHVRSKDLNGIILSHAHLDHSGGIPLFYLSESIPFFATPLTSEITGVLIRDMIKLSGYYLPFEFIEFNAMMKNKVDLGYHPGQRHGGPEGGGEENPVYGGPQHDPDPAGPRGEGAPEEVRRSCY
jgi:putative mRNA 3-end processing factor